MKLQLFACAAVGMAAAASLPVSGPHVVEHAVLRDFESRPDRIIGVEVWYPADRSAGPFALLLFAPGFGNRPSQYSSQLEDLASHGYVIAGVDPAADGLASFELGAKLWAQDLLAAKREILNSPVHAMIDTRKIGAFGHSLGGRAAAATCLLDSTILACMNQDGGDDNVELRRPYWPIESHDFAGAFAMLDWFDPGIDDEDLRATNKTREQYAASRLEPSPAALSAYRAARRGSYRITILAKGMQHTAFGDDLWSRSSSETQRTRYAGYLNQIRSITLEFFDMELKGIASNSACGGFKKESYTQCFTAVDLKTPN